MGTAMDGMVEPSWRASRDDVMAPASASSSSAGRRTPVPTRSSARTTRSVGDDDLATRRRRGPRARRARALAARRAPRRRARASCGCTRRPRAEGWDAPHTSIDVVIDDMPFLVDSVTMALDRRDLGVHLVVHPILGVRARPTATLARARPTGRAVTRRRRPRVVAAHRDRPRDSAEILDAVRTDLVRVLARRARRDRRLAEDARRGSTRSTTSSSAQPPPSDRRRARRRQGAAALDGRPALHVPRLPRVRPRTRRRRRRPPARGARAAGSGSCATDRRPDAARVRQLREAAAAAIRAKAREQTLLVLTKANARSTVHRPTLPRLRRRQALRRARRGRRRAPLPRAVHVGGVHRQPVRRPGAAPQGRRR